MRKQEVVFETRTPKKHSVRYSTKAKDAVVSDLYVKNSAFGNGSVLPKKLRLTIEEVKE